MAATKPKTKPKSGPRGGRPTTYDPAHCAKVLEFASEGAGRYEIAKRLGCAMSTFQGWEKAHPEFAAAMQDAQELAHGWWEEQGRRGIWSREFNANAYALQVRNRFPERWREKGDAVTASININLSSDDQRL